MCGIAGLWDRRLRGEGAALAGIAGAMTARIRHRGPDSDGFWTDEATGLAFGHRRLSILDLSPEGHQPMVSPGGRFVISYNGEIYNFPAVRDELRALGATFRGHSDTEVLVTAIERFGLRPTLDRVAGMFAFSLWDRRERRLHLVRDRLGKKPLYFGWLGEALVFGSELKAIAAHPDFAPVLDRDALTVFFRHQYIPAPWSIWRGIHKLPAGTMLSLDLDRVTPGEPLTDRIESYWSARAIAEAAATPSSLPPEEAVDALEVRIGEAVAERMVADVPIGALLSGGIDSSVIVALMQQRSSRPVKTFTIGFEESFYDEADAARAVATHLGTEHHELRISPADTLATIPALSHIYDEPFADPSAVPTLHVARLARSAVTVCLSGDGGDEVFAGYGRYALAARLGRGVDALPLWLRRAAAGAIRGVPAGAWDVVLRPFGGHAVGGLRGGHSGDRLHKMADMLAVADRDALYRALMSLTQRPADWVRDGTEPASVFTDPALARDIPDPIRRMMYLDTVTYLPDDILVKVDRASMAVSLEARAPLLDHRVVEFAWTLPVGLLRRDGAGKWPLRRIFDRHLPPELGQRPKQGFGMPVGEWLRGPLRDWAEALFDPGRIVAEGYLRAEPIRRMWDAHLTGARNFGIQLWTVATFQAWLDEGRQQAAEAPAGVERSEAA